MPTILKWKVFSAIGRRVAYSGDLPAQTFGATPGTRIYSQLALPLSNAYIPLALSPAATYHQTLRGRLQKIGCLQPNKKAPFVVPLPGVGDVPVYVQARVYPPNIVVLTLRLTIEADLTLDADFDTLIEWRNPTFLGGINEIVSYTIGVIDSGDHRAPTAGLRPKVYPAYCLEVVNQPSQIPQFVDDHIRNLIALLLGIHAPGGMDNELVTAVRRMNVEFNRKSSNELLMLNKQGLIFLTPQSDYRRPQSERFSRMLDLVEIAYVFQTYLSQFPGNRSGLQNFTSYVFTQIQAWIQHPEGIFVKSYTNRLTWEVISREFQLDGKLQHIQLTQAGAVSDIAGRLTTVMASAELWWLDPRFALHFEDPALTTVPAGLLSGITDAVLRLSIIRDLGEAERSLATDNFKAAVVMSGAAVEAMLLALLEQQPHANSAALRNQGLSYFLAQIRSRHLLADVGLINMLDSSLRDWRNFVHPGKALRVGVSLTKNHAQMAVAAAKQLAESIK